MEEAPSWIPTSFKMLPPLETSELNMERHDNPELQRKLLNHLADQYKIKEIREPNHLSSYIGCRTRTFFDQKQAIEPTDEEVMLFALGYGLQDVLTPKDAKAEVYQYDGVIYRPDMRLEASVADMGRLIELKTTRRSAKQHYIDESIPLTWLAYMKGGCKITGTDKYDLAVLYMMGNYCLSPGTNILRPDLTWTDIANLRVGDKVVGVDEYPTVGARGARRKLRNATVMSTGTRTLPSYRLWLSNGTHIVCSSEHLWLEQMNTPGRNTSPEWTATKQLKIGSRIRKLSEVWEHESSYDSGYIAAALDGEGHLEVGHGLRVGFSQKDNIMGVQFRRIMDEHGFYLTPSPTSGGTISYRTHDMQDALHILGIFRPVRLLNKLNLDGLALPMHNSTLQVEAIEDIGTSDVVAIETTTKTLIAEGLVSHNSPPFPQIYCDTFIFTQEEIDSNWLDILQHKQILDASLSSGVSPYPFQHCYDWECKYCRYKMMCEQIILAMHLPNPMKESIQEVEKLWE